MSDNPFNGTKDVVAATEALAEMEAERERLWLKAYGNQDRSHCNQDPVVNKEAKEAFDKMRNRIQRCVDALTANPHLREHFRCIMVDVHGTERVLSGGDIKQWLENPTHPLKLIAEQSGLAKAVATFMAERGCRITDAGGGCEGWHVGAYCTHEESLRLCDALYEQFWPFIAEGILLVERHRWSIDLKK